MTFVLKMAWRDSRASRRRLLLYSLSIVLGIAALVAIGSFSANLARAIDTQTKGLLGADLIVISRAAPAPRVQQFIDGLGGEQAHELGFSSMLAFPTAHDATRLVQVRAMEGNFPFYGDFTTLPADAPQLFRQAQTAASAPGSDRNVIILEDTILRQFGLKVGDPVKLGNAAFRVIGALEKLPGEGSAIAATFAPRALIPMRTLAATGLTAKPTLARYRTMLKLPAGADPEAIAAEMRARFSGERLSFDTVEHRKRDLGRALENIQAFLSLVGFVALFLGGIGVASAIGVYVRQKIATVAVLRCLGATVRQSFGVYVVQGLALGVCGAVLGALLGILVQVALPGMVRGLLPFDVDFFVSWPAVARGAGAGLAICFLFTLLPLLTIRRVSPLAALRSAYADRADLKLDPWRIATGVVLAGAVIGFALWQTRSVRLGLGFSGMIALGLAVLAGVAKLVVVLARRLSSGRRRWMRRLPYVLRQGVANLHRPQNRTVLLLFALGLGTFQMLTLYLTRSTLLREIEISGGGGRPNLLFFDIQDDEIGPLTKLVAQLGTPVQVSAPIVTMRIASINGRTVDQLLASHDDAHRAAPRRRGEPGRDREGFPAWTLRREYRSTYRAALTGTERIVQGRFVPRVPADTAVVPISIEEGLLRDMNLRLGDEIDWDVQGVPLRSRIASVRSVEWRRLEPNFFVVFPEGVLDAAPKFHVVALRAATPGDSARLQRAVVAAFPNVTAIDLALVMQTVDSVFSKVAFVVQFMALFTVVTGVIVLAGAVLMGRYQRIRETVLLRTVGATRRQLTQIMLVEYAVLGVLAAVTGMILAIAGNFLLARYVFRTGAVLAPGELAGAVAAAVAVTLVTGLLANRGVTNHPPLEVLRQET
ncbi:MAG TPA: FtsX-like permease family protein [Opitutaceae bacterium]|nr:FtsX-like permease family protein [Opitutaceae bacterium]